MGTKKREGLFLESTSEIHKTKVFIKCGNGQMVRQTKSQIKPSRITMKN